MKILKQKPPFLDKIHAAGMKPNINRTIFTYGDILYNPGGIEIPDYLMEHELVHVRQQGKDPDAWWDKYLADHNFRLSQEIEAYGRQFQYMCQKFTNPNQRDSILRQIATILSGPTYGYVIDRKSAEKRVLKKAYL